MGGSEFGCDSWWRSDLSLLINRYLHCTHPFIVRGIQKFVLEEGRAQSHSWSTLEAENCLCQLQPRLQVLGMLKFYNHGTYVASLSEGKSRGLCLVQLCAKYTSCLSAPLQCVFTRAKNKKKHFKTFLLFIYSCLYMVSKCQLDVLLLEGKCAIKRQLYSKPFTLWEAAFLYFSTQCSAYSPAVALDVIRSPCEVSGQLQ